MKQVHLAVNGSLMRGLELNKNLTDANAQFVREDKTSNCYRIWSINDVHPAMLKVEAEGTKLELEIWSVPAEGLAEVLMNEPAGLSIGKVLLEDGSEVLGVLGESWLCNTGAEITSFGGWRNYIKEKRPTSE